MEEHLEQIAIITDDPGWHGRQLQSSLKEHGLTSRFVSLRNCALHILGDGNELILPGFVKTPLGVFVRGIPGGSLEQVIFRMDILHALHDFGITVYNTPRAIERTVDKPLTSFLLSRAGLPTPKTWICESWAQAQNILDRESVNNKKLVLKPLFGSQGISIYLLDKKTGLIHDDKFAGVYYLQQFIERGQSGYSDIRVFVIDGVAKAAMLRHSENWITNRAQGAVCEAVRPDGQIRTLAEAACRRLDIDYAGIDLIQDSHGQFYIIEVNSIPAWYGLQGVVNFNIASCLIDSFVDRMTKNNQLKLCSN